MSPKDARSEHISSLPLLDKWLMTSLVANQYWPQTGVVILLMLEK